jgi:hypothetical protein
MDLYLSAPPPTEYKGVGLEHRLSVRLCEIQRILFIFGIQQFVYRGSVRGEYDRSSPKNTTPSEEASYIEFASLLKKKRGAALIFIRIY